MKKYILINLTVIALIILFSQASALAGARQGFAPKDYTGSLTKATAKAKEKATAKTCTHKGQSYKIGKKVCINKVKYQCGKHGWFSLNLKC
mgnify:CR=1 FL=1